MSGDATQELIRELASELKPVKPLPRLRFVALAVGLLWLAIAALEIALKGVAPTLRETLAMPVGAGGILAALLVAGAGGVAAALALAVPGRERLARGAFALGVAGTALAAGIGLALVARSPLAEWRLPDAHDWPCLATALAVALLPALALGWFGGRAAPFRPLSIALAAAAGAAALGGSVAQASCAASEPMHALLGHALVPALGAFALTLPLLLVLRRGERGRAE
jgi:hypothetical protein